MGRTTKATVFFLTLVIAFVIYRSMTIAEYECEVCVSFHGRTACRSAAGGTAQDATRTAQDNACAFVASGMRETVECTGRPPASATCKP